MKTKEEKLSCKNPLEQKLLEAVTLYIYAVNKNSDKLCGEAYWFMREAAELATGKSYSTISLNDVWGEEARKTITLNSQEVTK